MWRCNRVNHPVVLVAFGCRSANEREVGPVGEEAGTLTNRPGSKQFAPTRTVMQATEVARRSHMFSPNGSVEFLSGSVCMSSNAVPMKVIKRGEYGFDVAERLTLDQISRS